MYPVISGIVFALVAAVHLVRAVNGWPVQVAEWSISVTVSWVAVFIAGALAAWAFTARSRDDR